MTELGSFAQSLAWILTFVGIISGALAGIKHSEAWFQTAKQATILVFVSAFTALFALGYAFVESDFTNQYVWQHSNRDMATIYKITAIWGGMDGSMLLWAALLTLASALVAFWSDAAPRRLMSWTLAAANSSAAFFFTIVVFLTNPFRYIKADFIPPDGNGLNPLLQNPFMAVHPPLLYLGFTFFSIPFAFCLAALLSRTLSNDWIRLTRRWTLIGWGFLTAGIVMGGHWAYIELGWGGFWAWDPVENASFLPWLTGTAFLHSVMVQERKNMLKFWNIWLVTLTYTLTVFGTFLTRSGIVQSVHAFASTNVGWVFLVYIGVVVVVTALLCWVRKDDIRSERKIESLFSREAAFLMNNLLFLSICFATLWGVMFPVVSEWLTGVKQVVGIPFFNAVNVPLFLLLIFLMGFGPLIAWRKANWNQMKRTFIVPFVLALLSALLLVWAGIVSFFPVLSYALCVFVLMTIMGEIHRGLRAQAALQHPGTLGGVGNLVRRHKTRYGGYLVHLGVVIVAFAITASMAHKNEKEFSLGQGESFSIGRFTLSLDSLTEVQQSNYTALRALVSLREQGAEKVLKVLHPELRIYAKNRETTTEVALRVGMREDVYLVLAGIDDSGTRGAFKVFINPLQVWLWFGAMVMLAGTVVVLLPEVFARQRSAVAEGAQVKA